MAWPPVDISATLREYADKKRKIYPCHANRASELGHPCARYLYYCRTAWEERELPSPELQMIFDAGNALEDFTVRQLEDAGLVIHQRQRSFTWRIYNITGHVDGMIQAGDKTYPLEIKHLSHWSTRSLNSIEDFTQAKQVYLQKYPVQLALYMLMSNNEYGCMLIRSKQDFQPKDLWFSFDDVAEIAEEALKRAEIVNEAVNKGFVPDRMAFTEECVRCAFFVKCAPDQRRDGGIECKEGQEELLRLLAELEQTEEKTEKAKAVVKERDELRDNIKAVLGDSEDPFIVGDWYINPTERWPKKAEKIGKTD